jgi:Aminoglycoside adenylyltransferase, C-terminal domain
VLHPGLQGIYAGGSWALDDYVAGRSDLDVAVVTREGLATEVATHLIAAVRHEALPCPARGLELVVYRASVAASGSPAPGFELNFNSGRAMEARLDRHGAAEDSHWFAIDRAILAQRGKTLVGPPAADVFTPPPRAALLDLLAESIRWYESESGPPVDAVLNACRALCYARTGSWSSKDAAARWMIEQDPAASVVLEALAARRGDGPVDQEAVRDFLHRARRQLSSVPASIGR